MCRDQLAISCWLLSKFICKFTERILFISRKNRLTYIRKCLSSKIKNKLCIKATSHHNVEHLGLYRGAWVTVGCQSGLCVSKTMCRNSRYFTLAALQKLSRCPFAYFHKDLERFFPPRNKFVDIIKCLSNKNL